MSGPTIAFSLLSRRRHNRRTLLPSFLASLRILFLYVCPSPCLHLFSLIATSAHVVLPLAAMTKPAVIQAIITHNSLLM